MGCEVMSQINAVDQSAHQEIFPQILTDLCNCRPKCMKVWGLRHGILCILNSIPHTPPSLARIFGYLEKIRMKKNSNIKNIELKDSAEDKKHLQGDEATLDLPDVGDIPGQENRKKTSVTSPSSDTTISSADEEGNDIFDDEEDIVTDKKTNVGSLERKLLDDAYDPISSDSEPIDQISLDDKDNEGEMLNEDSMDKDLFGKDLDTDIEEEEDEE